MSQIQKGTNFLSKSPLFLYEIIYLSFLALLSSHLALAGPELIFAARKGYINRVEHLIDKRDNVNDINSKGNTALMGAAMNGHIEVVRALLTRNDLKVNQTNKYGDTALIMAAENGHIAVVQALLTRKDLEINQANNLGDTALIRGTWCRYIEVVRALLTREDLAIDQPNEYGNTALILAVQRKLTEIANLINRTRAIRISNDIYSLEELNFTPDLADIIASYETGVENASRVEKQ